MLTHDFPWANLLDEFLKKMQRPIQLYLTVGHQPAYEVSTYYTDPWDLTIPPDERISTTQQQVANFPIN